MPCTVTCTEPPGRLSRSDMRAMTPILFSDRASIGSSGAPGASTSATRMCRSACASSTSRLYGAPIWSPSTAVGKTIVLRSGITGSWSGTTVSGDIHPLGSLDQLLGCAGKVRSDAVDVARHQPALPHHPSSFHHHVRNVPPGPAEDDVGQH